MLKYYFGLGQTAELNYLDVCIDSIKCDECEETVGDNQNMLLSGWSF